MAENHQQRRLSAVLVADVVGYTRLVEQDTDGTVAAWKSARADIVDPTVAAHSGRLVKLTGDGFLAEFSSVQDAVKCAVSLQQGLSANPLDFRMGVNLGDVVDDGEDIHGEGVNIAARIEALAEPGGICISGSVHEQVRNWLDHGFEDLGEHEVKHVSALVKVYRIVVDGGGPKDTAGTSLVRPDKPSIAVLPFDNMSSDPEQDFFADGLSEDIIMALSQYPGLLVIARNSTFVYKGRAVDIATVAGDLDVAYVLEGSVRKAGQRIRVTAQLIDTGSGAHIWAESYDRDLNDIFAVQDEITLNIVSNLGQQISEGQYATASRQGTNNLAAWRAVVQSIAAFHDTSEAGIDSALENLREAIRLDPDYAYARAVLAYHYAMRVRYGWSRDEEADLARSFEAADAASAIAPDLFMAFCARGFALVMQKKYDDCVQQLRRAVVLAPGSSFAKFMLGGVLNFCGGQDEAILLIVEARRLDPFHGPWVLGVLGHALRLAGRYNEALTIIAEHQTVRAASGHDDRVIALVEMGRTAEVREAARELRQKIPDFNIDSWAKRQYYQDPERLRRDLEALRSAGLG